MEDKELASLKVGGVFSFELVRDGKVIDTWEEKNRVVNEGLNYLLSTSLGGGTQELTFYVGIYQGNYTPIATDAASNIALNATECTSYNEVTRPEWVDADSSTQEITNTASKAQFTISATETIYGAFLISDNTISGTTGTLFAASKFSSSRSVVAGDQLLVTYTVIAASA